MASAIRRQIAATMVGGTLIAATLSTVSHASPTPLDLADAGQVTGWSASGSATAIAFPDELKETAAKQIVAGSNMFTFVLDANGKLSLVGNDPTGGTFPAIPAEVSAANIRSVHPGVNFFGAIDHDGKPYVWGLNLETPNPRQIPEDLPPLKSMAFIGQLAIGITETGGTVLWGDKTSYPIIVYSLTGQNNIASIATTYADHTYLLKNNGTVAAVGSHNAQNQLVLPPDLTNTGDTLNVKAVYARSTGGLALMSDGTLRTWGGDTATGQEQVIPAGLTGKTVKLADSKGRVNVALTSDDELYVWGNSSAANLGVTSGTELSHTLSDITVTGTHIAGIIPKVMQITKPTITGTPTVGQTLTATDATFSGATTGVTGQWKADGQPLAGQTGPTLTLTAAHANKKISYASTATGATNPEATSESEQTSPVVLPKTASTLRVSAPTKTYGTSGKVTVSISSSGNRTATGKVTLTGTGRTLTGTIRANKATITLPKNLAAKTYTLTAKYVGNSVLNPSTRTAKFTVRKGKVRSVTIKVNKTPTSKKSGKATITVANSSGLAKATGKVTITLKKGKTTKKINTKLSAGKRTINLPKLAKGTWKAQATYRGDKNYNTTKSKTHKIKTKK